MQADAEIEHDGVEAEAVLEDAAPADFFVFHGYPRNATIGAGL
jgi:hypothetical protein